MSARNPPQCKRDSQNGSDRPNGTVRPWWALRCTRRCRQPQHRPVVARAAVAANCGALTAPSPRCTLVRVPRRGACECRRTRVACGAQSTTVSGSSPGGPPPAPRTHGRARRCRQPKGAAVHSSRTVDADARRGVAPRRTHGRSGSDRAGDTVVARVAVTDTQGRYRPRDVSVASCTDSMGIVVVVVV